jgi:hypothetical protein
MKRFVCGPLFAAVVAVPVLIFAARNRTTIDSKGFYTFPLLPVGGYRLEFELHGFRQQRRTGLVIDADSALIEDATIRSPKERTK